MTKTYNVYRDGEKIASKLTETKYTDTDLTPDTTYEYQISAENEFGESDLTAAVSVTTDGVAPEEPEEVQAESNDDTSADLDWE